MLNQLTIIASRLSTSSSSIDIIKLNRTLINKQKIEALVEFLNSYIFIYKLKLSRIKKTVNTMIANTILTQNSIKLLFRANMTRKTRKKKAKEDDRARYRFAYERVLIETVTRQHREDEMKKVEEVRQKKKTFETKKMITIEKKRVHMKEMIMRKKKREKAKIAKELKKTSKSKRAYRKRLLASSISEQESSISVKTSAISKNSYLSTKKTQARSSTSS